MTVLRERYTPTDIGPSPLDWEAPLLSDVSSLIANGFVGTATPHYTDETGVRYLYGTNIRANRIDLTGLRYVTHGFDEEVSKTQLKKGDLLTVQSGHIGTTAVVPSELEGANCHALIVTRLDHAQVDPDFLSQYLNSEIGTARMRGLEVGSTILHINTKDLKRFRIPLPPLPEQQKIAAILSTWDRAIDLTEKLIAAKQKRKQALMQQLLTGKVRFAGFSDKWLDVRMGDLFERRSESGISDLPMLSVTMDQGMIRRDSIERKMDTKLNAEQHLLVRKGDIAYNMMRMWQGASGLALEDGLVSPAYIVLKPTSEVDPLFASYFFKLRHTVKQFEFYSFGITGDRLRLYYKDFASIPTKFPTLKEQKKIASVLSTTDCEIELYKSSFLQLQKQKKGLMQQLLTGKVRVKTDQEVVKG